MKITFAKIKYLLFENSSNDTIKSYTPQVLFIIVNKYIYVAQYFVI